MAIIDAVRRRRFQFGLRELFWLILTIAVASYGVQEHRERVRAQQELQEARDSLVQKEKVIARSERAAAVLQKSLDAISLEMGHRVQRNSELEQSATLNGVSPQPTAQE